MSFAYVGNYAKLGAMKELDELIKENNFDLSQFEPGILGMHQYNGKQVSLPRDANIVIMYYNKDMFDKANLPYPKMESTWEEIFPLAQKLTIDKNGNTADSPNFDKENIVQWGLCVDAAGMGDAVLEPQLWSNGARLVDDNMKLTLNTPEAMEVLTFFRDLYVKYHVNPSASTITGLGGNPIPAFGTGKIAMAFGGSWSATDFKNTDFEFGTILPPKFKETKTCVQPAGYAMSPFTKQEKGAWILLSWLVGPEGQKEVAKLNDGIPANKEAAEAYLQLDEGFDKQIFIEAQKYSIPAPWGPGKERLMWEFLPQVLQLPLQGEGDLESAVKEIESLMASIE